MASLKASFFLVRAGIAGSRRLGRTPGAALSSKLGTFQTVRPVSVLQLKSSLYRSLATKQEPQEDVSQRQALKSAETQISSSPAANQVPDLPAHEDIQLDQLKRVVGRRPALILPLLTLVPLSLTSFVIVSAATYGLISYNLALPDGIEMVESLRGIGVNIPSELIEAKDLDAITSLLMGASLWYRVVASLALIPVLSPLIRIGGRRPKPAKVEPSISTDIPASSPENVEQKTAPARPGRPYRTVRFGGLDDVLKKDGPTSGHLHQTPQQPSHPPASHTSTHSNPSSKSTH